MKRLLFILLWSVAHFCSLASGKKYPGSQVPGRPRNVECQPLSPKGIFVTWEPPRELAGTVVAYNVYYLGTKDRYMRQLDYSHAFKKSTTANKMSLHGLSQFLHYKIQVVVASEDVKGLADHYDDCHSYDGEKLCTPIEVESTASGTINLEWKCGNNDTSSIAGYNINYISLIKPEKVYMMTLPHSDVTTYTLKDLHNDETYEISMEVFDKHEKRLHFDVVQTRVTGIVPTRTCIPKMEIASKTYDGVTVKWECETAHRTKVKGYTLLALERTGRTSPVVIELQNNYTSYAFKNLDCGRSYKIVIEACDENDTYEDSKIDNIILGDKEATKRLVESNWIGFPFFGTLLDSGGNSLIAAGNRKETRISNVLKGCDGFAVTIPNQPGQYCHCHPPRPPCINHKDRKGPGSSQSELRSYVGRPPIEEFLEIGEDSVTMKLDVWRFNCPFDTFWAYITSEMDRTHRQPETVDMADVNRMMFTQLKPNTEYFLEASNIEAKKREQFRFRTLCNNKTYIPKNPRKEDVIEEGRNDVTIHLEKFTCFTEFSVDYRKNTETSWKLISNNIPVGQKSLLIQQLISGASYKVRITGRYKYGESVAEYSVSSNDEACGDWILLKNRCIKIITEAGMLVKSEAQKVCLKMQENEDTVSLLTIRSEDEVERMTDILRFNASLNSVWLGMQSDNGKEYKWDNGPEVDFTDWSLSPYEKEPRCAKASLDDDKHFTFAKTNCNSRNYVACEKPYPWNLVKVRQQFADLKEDLYKKIKNLEMQLKS